MRIARVYFDVHMGQAFAGLMSICHKSGFKPEEKADSYVVFINKKRTKFKLLVGNQYLIYHDNKDKQFPLEAIQHLPQAFTGKQFEFATAVDKAIRTKMELHH
jgi:hypothetical protein